MPVFLHLLLRALPVLALLLVGPMLLPYPLAYLPEGLYTVLPIDPFTLVLLLSGLLAGLCLALLARGQRLATGALVMLGLLGAQAGIFYGNLCSDEETRRVHTELAAMPHYNLAQLPSEQPLYAELQPTQTHVSHNCLLPEDRLDGATRIAVDLFSQVLAFLGCLLIWRRPHGQALAS